MNVSLIYPSRGRPEKCASTLDKWIARAAVLPEIILSVDSDDKDLKDYEAIADLSYPRLVVNPNQNIVQAVNHGAKQSTGDILVVISDDFDNPPQHWDSLIIEAIEKAQKEGYEDGILLRVNDMSDNEKVHQPWIVTLPIMDRLWYERCGYVYHPDYQHMFCDTDQTHMAELAGTLVDASHIRIPHNHWQSGLNELDNTNIRANSTWDQGEKLYAERAANNFGLKSHEVLGSFTYKEHAAHIAFMAQRGFKIPFTYA